MKTNEAIIITDPCYIMKEEDWDNSLGEFLPDCFSEYISESTIYGDWSCELKGIYKIVTEDLDEAVTYCKENENQTMTLGLFCADAGMVCVVKVKELLQYNPSFFEEYGTWTYSVYPSGPELTWSYEVDENTEAHIVARDKTNRIVYLTIQTGA